MKVIYENFWSKNWDVGVIQLLRYLKDWTLEVFYTTGLTCAARRPCYLHTRMHLHQNTAPDHTKTSMWRGKNGSTALLGRPSLTKNGRKVESGNKVHVYGSFTPAISTKTSAQIEAQHQTGKTAAICSQHTSGSTASSNCRTFKAIQRKSQHPPPCVVSSSSTIRTDCPAAYRDATGLFVPPAVTPCTVQRVPQGYLTYWLSAGVGI